MLHLDVIVPADQSDDVATLLSADDRVTAVTVQPGVARRPVGDLISCDVAREAASDVLDTLRELGIDDTGSIRVLQIAVAPSADMISVEQAAPGAPDDAVVWQQVEEQAIDAIRQSWSYYAFLTLATMIAAVAVTTDSSILVVGAMVVGPEFAVVAALSLGCVLRRRMLVWGAIKLLVKGFGYAIVSTALLALVARGLGWIDLATVTGPRPLTGFIWRPDRWSLVVAVLAGVVGVLSYTAGRTNALVGVFISVTTVPAAGDLALSVALGAGQQIGGSAAQLGLNIAGMVVAGSLTLLVQRQLWRRITARGRAGTLPEVSAEEGSGQGG